MLRARSGLLGGIAVAALLLLTAGGLFVLQSARAATVCLSGGAAAACSATPTAQTALDGLFVSVAGLLAALVIAVISGVSWRSAAAPNVALARRLAEEDEAFQEAQARGRQLQELRAVALAHARAEATAAKAKAAAQAAAQNQAGQTGAQAGAPAWAFSEPAAGWELREEKHVETPDERRRRALIERLRLMAKNKPQNVADVLRVWINEPPRH